MKDKKVLLILVILLVPVLLILVGLMMAAAVFIMNRLGADNSGRTEDSLSAVHSQAETMASDTITPTDASESMTIFTQPVTEPAAEYVTIQLDAENVHRGNLILVNDLHPCVFDHASVLLGKKSDVALTTIKSILDTKETFHYTAADREIGLDQEAAYAMDAWLEGFYEATGNKDIRIIGGYKADASDPEFHAGRTCTLGIFPEEGASGPYEETGTYAWLGQHAHEYGFVLRYPQEKASFFSEDTSEMKSAVFRYVGEAAAAYMYQNGFCLEEYLEMIRGYTADDMLEVTTASGVYGVYYVPAVSDGSTSIIVRSDEAAYEISGNNMDGFVVTVALK